MLLVGRQEGHPACKNLSWWGAGVVICLEQGADLHMAQLMPLPLTVSCFSKIQIGFTFLVPAHPGSPGKGAVKRVQCSSSIEQCTIVVNGTADKEPNLQSRLCDSEPGQTMQKKFTAATMRPYVELLCPLVDGGRIAA